MIRRHGGVRIGWACGLCSAIGVVDVVVNPGAAVGAQPHPELVERVELWTRRRLVALALAGPGARRGLPDLVRFAEAG